MQKSSFAEIHMQRSSANISTMWFGIQQMHAGMVHLLAYSREYVWNLSVGQT